MRVGPLAPAAAPDLELVMDHNEGGNMPRCQAETCSICFKLFQETGCQPSLEARRWGYASLPVLGSRTPPPMKRLYVRRYAQRERDQIRDHLSNRQTHSESRNRDGGRRTHARQRMRCCYRPSPMNCDCQFRGCRDILCYSCGRITNRPELEVTR